MRVLYDHQIFDMQHVGGISRYFSALMAGMPDYDLALRYTDNLYVRALPGIADTLAPKESEYSGFAFGIRFRGRNRLFRLWNKVRRRPLEANQAISIAKLKAGDFDIFHPTYYDPYFLPYLQGKPFVLTIHDMIHEKYPEFFSLDEPTGFQKRLLAERADRIIAISERTKRDIVEVYGIPESRIDVVYHGSDLSGSKILPAGIDAGRYLLYMGTRTAYKNFYFMVAALAPLIRERSGLSLVCTGPALSSEERRFLSTLGISERVVHRFVDDESLRALYANALCFIFPSYYEGFGIPILEAFGAGCPSVLADASCFREIAGDAALYFAPKDSEALRRQVTTILEDQKLSESLARKGLERANCFSWKMTVDATLQSYEKANSRSRVQLSGQA